MTALIPFAFEDNLIRVVKPNGEPWFVGRDVCRVLEVKNESDALGRLDDDERNDGVAITDPMGREQTVICVSEAGVYRLVFTSRKPQAERFKRWLAHEVLPKLRREGFYALPGAETAPPAAAAPAEDGPLAALNAKLGLIREARLLFGAGRAAALWESLGLPPVPAGAPSLLEDARACLQHLLLEKAHGVDKTLGELIEDALADDHDVAKRLQQSMGIRVVAGEAGGIAVSNLNPWLLESFRGTPWDNGVWRTALRRLPGARAMGPMRFAGTMQRSTFLPADAMEDVR